MKSMFRCITVFVIPAICLSLGIKECTFSEYRICDVGIRIEKSCSITTPRVRSSLECLARCNLLEEDCVGASTTEAKICYIHQACPELTSCSEISTDHTFFSKTCDNGGTWDWEVNSCKCVNGWAGHRCQHLPTSCDDLLTAGYISGSHQVTLDLSSKNLPNIEVYCWIKNDVQTFSFIHVMKNSGQTAHNKDWRAFREGYKINDDHLWLGLRKWNILSAAGYNTLTVRTSFFMSGLKRFEWNYHNFTLSGEDQFYAFNFSSADNKTFGGFSEHQVGDCLSVLENVPFSTWDADHDLDPVENCAEVVGAGWWHAGCDGPCRLLAFNVGYKNLLPAERLIALAGIDMEVIGQYLLSIQMLLITPPHP